MSTHRDTPPEDVHWPRHINFIALPAAGILLIWMLYSYLANGFRIVTAVISAVIIALIGYVVLAISLLVAWALWRALCSLIRPARAGQKVEQEPVPDISASLQPRIDFGEPSPIPSTTCRIDYSPMAGVNGKSLQAIHTYIVLDTETTGLSKERDRIVEISLGRYEDGTRLDHYSTLINPSIPISPGASRVNHITDADVANAPTISDIWPRVRRFFDGSVVVGHNVTFDLGMLGHGMPSDAEPFDVTYLDTVRLAKLAFPGQPSYKLVELVRSLGIAESQDHRAESDVELTAQLFERCRAKIIADYNADLAARRASREQQKAEKRATYAWSPLLDKNFVFTGEFQHNRSQLEAILQKVGANLRDKVNGNTDFLVTGRLENLPQWALDRKHGKAQELAAAGKNVRIISEKQYLALIHEAAKQIPEEEK